MWLSRDDAELAQEPSIERQLLPTPSTCDVSLTTSRSREEGGEPIEERLQLSDVPCASYEFDLTGEFNLSRAYFELSDAFGNSTVLTEVSP